MSLMFSWELLLTAGLIAFARIVDVSLGTIRMIFVTKGRKVPAFFLGFLEAGIWVIAVSKVSSRLDEPLLVIAFAFGYAAGNYIGVSLDQWMGFGHLLIRVFTRKGEILIPKLRDSGWRITQFHGHGQKGSVDMLLMKIRRKEQSKLFRHIRAVDPESYFIVDDVHSIEGPTPSSSLLGLKVWTQFTKRK